MDFLFPVAYAQEPGQQTLTFNLILFGGMFLLFWLLILRPQSKRAKEHRDLVASIGKGDEVLTSGGLLGKVVRVSEDYLAVDVGTGLEVKIQKAAIAAVLPKGTLAKI